MKSKASLTLIELLIMLLVFAFAAALCLQAFARADRISGESARLDSAVTLAQSAAEALKANSGNFEKASACLGGEWDENCWTISEEDYELRATLVQSGYPQMGQSEILVCEPEGETVFSLTVVWQKGVDAHE